MSIWGIPPICAIRLAQIAIYTLFVVEILKLENFKDGTFLRGKELSHLKYD